MRAVRFHQHGDAEVMKYEEAPDPKPGPNEVVVRVKACAMNHLDIWVRGGLPGVKVNLPHILGCDIAGVVEDAGPGAEHIQKGMETLVHPGINCGRCPACLTGNDSICPAYTILGGYLVDGGYAELVKVPAANVLPRVKALSWEENASIPLVFLTAWHMLVGRANLRPGEDVLVHSAGSGVGIAAVQIAKLLGARVFATVGSDEKVARAKALGADEVINYRTHDFETEVKRLTGKKGVEVVVEHVGPEVFEKSVRVLARNGRLVTCGATSGPAVNLDLRFLFSKHLNLLGSYMGGKHELLSALQFFEKGRLKPVVDSVFPLEKAAEAHRHMEARKNFGKIVMRP